MDNREYNGWYNYATWRVNLEIVDGINWDSEMNDGANFESVTALSDYISEMVYDVIGGYGEATEGLALDYAWAFVSEVNFRDIAANVAENYPGLIRNA